MMEREEDLAAQGLVSADEWFTIGNEFASVRLRKVLTRNGERLEIRVMKTGESILLDAMQLEIITGQDPEVFSEMLRQRLGLLPGEGE